MLGWLLCEGLEGVTLRANGSDQPNYIQGGNVSAHLGMLKPEETLAQAELAHHSGELIKRQGLTQVEMPRLLDRD